MSSVFAALEDQLSSVCDSTFGESFQIRPMTYGPGGGRRTADGSRTAATITGIYEAPLFKSTEFGVEARGSMPALMIRPTLSADVRQFSAYGPPKQYDVVARLGTGAVYELATVEIDAEGRYKLGLKQIGTE